MQTKKDYESDAVSDAQTETHTQDTLSEDTTLETHSERIPYSRIPY